MKIHRAETGFSLIELMVVVAIIGILAMIAYPSYTEHVAKTRRGEAKSALLEASQFMERRYTMNNTYVGATLPTLTGTVATYYTRRLATGGNAPTASTYMIEMVPQGTMVNDKCGTFNVNQAGTKDVSGTSSGATSATCWQ